MAISPHSNPSVYFQLKDRSLLIKRDLTLSGRYAHQPDEPFFDYAGMKMKETLNKFRNNPS
jgi:hypothetical protein